MDYYKDTKKMFHRGDVVRIKEDSNLEKTDRTFTATDPMHELRGIDMIVEGMNSSDKCRAGCVKANDWSWNPEDLYVVKYADEGPPLINDGPEGIFKFDPKCL